MDCCPPGFFVHGISQARILEWIALPSSRGSSWPGIEPNSLTSPALAGEFFTTSTTWEVLGLCTEMQLIFVSVSSVQFSSLQSLSCVQLFATPWTAACQSSLSITNSRSLLKLMSIELVMPSNHLILCHPLLLLPSVFPSIRVFSNESVLCIRWPNYWSFSFSISPSNEYLGLISFRIDWSDLLAVLNTIVQKHQFFGTQLSL